MNERHAEMYLRRSRAEADDPHILAKHEVELLRLARYDSVTIPPEAIHREIASGDDIAHRPIFSRLLDRWERLRPDAGGIIYSTEVSRLTRGHQSDQGRVQHALQRAHILHRTRARWYDLRVDEDCTAWELEGFVSRLSLRVDKTRFAAARYAQVLAGQRRNGSAPFGYRPILGTTRIEPHPDEFPILKAMIADAWEMSCARLAVKYGLPHWRVKNVLHSPTICGWPAQYKAIPKWERGERYARRLPREEWVWPEQPGDYEPAMSREEWERLQQVIAARADRRAKTGSTDGWCRGVVRFVGYDGPIRIGSWNTHTPRGYLTYEESAASPRLYIRRSLVHAAALNAVRPLASSPDRVRDAIRDYCETQSARPAIPADLRRLRRLLAERRRELDEATAAMVAAADPELRASFQRLQTEQLEAIRALKAEIDRATSAAAPPAVGTDLIARLPEVMNQFDRLWERIHSDADRQMIIEVWVQRIECICEPVPGRHGWRREVLRVVLQPWVPDP